MDTDNDGPSHPYAPSNTVPPGYFSASFERLIRENEMADWASAFTLFGGYSAVHVEVLWSLYRLCGLSDTLETFFDARIDLIQRALTEHRGRLRIRAEEAMNKMKTPAGEDLAENLDREMQKFKIKVCINYLYLRWVASVNALGHRASFWIV
jgi:hypothetical protein